jgi:hypothetical protein
MRCGPLHDARFAASSRRAVSCLVSHMQRAGRRRTVAPLGSALPPHLSCIVPLLCTFCVQRVMPCQRLSTYDWIMLRDSDSGFSLCSLRRRKPRNEMESELPAVYTSPPIQTLPNVRGLFLLRAECFAHSSKQIIVASPSSKPTEIGSCEAVGQVICAFTCIIAQQFNSANVVNLHPNSNDCTTAPSL